MEPVVLVHPLLGRSILVAVVVALLVVLLLPGEPVGQVL
jgi:hypothetical protein